jgi:hypothetical protein
MTLRARVRRRCTAPSTMRPLRRDVLCFCGASSSHPRAVAAGLTAGGTNGEGTFNARCFEPRLASSSGWIAGDSATTARPVYVPVLDMVNRAIPRSERTTAGRGRSGAEPRCGDAVPPSLCRALAGIATGLLPGDRPAQQLAPSGVRATWNRTTTGRPRLGPRSRHPRRIAPCRPLRPLGLPRSQYQSPARVPGHSSGGGGPDYWHPSSTSRCYW